jgi:tetratricopeptide (TPR) repeat protein
MCQWIPLHAMSDPHFRQLVAAFVAVFPDSAVFFVDGAVALIGGNEPFAIPYARVAERLSDPGARADLAAVGFDDPVRAIATFVAGGETLRKFVEGAAPVTDERPVLEFHPLPPRVVFTHLWANTRSMEDLRGSYERLPVDVTGVSAAEDVETRLFLALRAGQHLLRGAAELEANQNLVNTNGDPAQAFAAALNARDAFRTAVSVDPRNLGAVRSYESASRAVETAYGWDALRHYRRALEFRALRQQDAAWTRLAETLARQEKFEEALEAATEATRLFPRGLDARCERAYARAALGDMAGAREDYLRALEGEDAETLTDVRIRHDAERALASTVPPDTRPLDARIEAALAGEKTARIPAPLVLRILAGDDPRAFAARFGDDFRRASSAAEDAAARVAALDRLALARPEGATEVARKVLTDEGTSAPAPVLDAAARAVARTSPRLLAEMLRPETAPAALAATARAAGTVRGFACVDALLPLLLHADATVRRAAQFSLFAALGDKAPGLARLDTSAFPAKSYAEAVRDLVAWWVRERVRLESSE